MILAPQRLSVDVITGTTKANFPARVAYRVSQKVDSRTIIDQGGADKLLGRGDMLFLPSGPSRLIRVHGGFITENETNRVTAFLVTTISCGDIGVTEEKIGTMRLSRWSETSRRSHGYSSSIAWLTGTVVIAFFSRSTTSMECCE